jgi:DNA-binding transcriptional LysR family regulator
VLHLLETFCTVADCGSLSRAAELLHLSQPAVTRQIKALEQELGAVLLTRSAHGVHLTPVGEKVLVHARQALSAVAACRQVAAEFAGAGDHLRVAAGHMVFNFLLPPVLARFRQEHPEVEITLYTGHYQECLDRLTAYEADLALVSTPPADPALRAVPLLRDPVVAVVAPGNRQTLKAGLALADLRGETLLVLPRASGFRQVMGAVLAEAGVDCHLVEQPSVEAIKTMVALQMGIALLPQSAVREEVQRGKLAAVPLTDWPDNGRMVLAVTRSEGSLPLPVRLLLKALKDWQEQG